MSHRSRCNVMVSSTARDLPDHRKAVIDAIWRRGMFPLVMETATATPADAIQFSLDLVKDADVYVGIFGFRYGYRPKDAKLNRKRLSITELEYRDALKRKIPILIFMMDDKHPTPVNVGEAKTFFESDPQSEEMLNRLKNELKLKYVCGFFKSPQELSELVYQALTELRDKGKLQCDDEVRSNKPPDGNKIFHLPIPPEPYVVHPYILTRAFVGRKHELSVLDTWAKSSDTILIVEAIGGIGKSALTWEWFQQHARDFDGAFWWSFYESDSTMTNFTRHALAYLNGKVVKDYDDTTADERERELMSLLRQKRILLVLDGFERLLIAYHRIDAPQLLDEDIENSHLTTIVEDVDLRACIDLRNAAFLRRLTTCAPSKVLISTRLVPSDLEDKSGSLMPLVGAHHLHGLHPDDALELMHHLGVKGDGESIRAFTEEFDNHTLLLGIIAGRVNEYRQAPGDFTAWYEGEGRDLRLHDLNMSQKRTGILHYALAGLRPEVRKLLSQLAAFRYPVDYETISAFNPYLPTRPTEVKLWTEKRITNTQHQLEKEKNEKTKEYLQQQLSELQTAHIVQKRNWETYQGELKEYEAQVRGARVPFHNALRELEDRGLLQWDRRLNRYDLHPVVRAFAFEDMPEDERRNTYQRIRDHFEALPSENLDEIQEIGQLQHSLEIYHALINAYLFENASEFYGQRLRKILYRQLSSYQTIIELLSPLFTNGVDHLPNLLSEGQQSSRGKDMANALSQVGEARKALQLRKEILGFDVKRGSASNIGVSLRNYATSLRDNNQLVEALRAVKLAWQLANVEGIRYREYEMRWSEVYILGSHRDTGHWQEFDQMYKAFDTYYSSSMQPEIERYYAETLIDRGMDAEEVLNRAWALAVDMKNTAAMHSVLNLRGEVALKNGEAKMAVAYFLDASVMAQKSGIGGVISRGGLARARVAQGEHEEALTLLEQGVNSNDAAEVYLNLGEHSKAEQYALIAYKWGWADGPPYTRWWYLERAKRVLSALGIAVPAMPPFDETKVQKIPYEDEILGLISEFEQKGAGATSDAE